MEGEVEIIGLGGAIGDGLAEPDTAFSNRGYLLWLNVRHALASPATKAPITVWSAWLRSTTADPADDPDYIGRTRMAHRRRPGPLGRRRGVYVNMLNFDEQDRVLVEALGRPGEARQLPASRPSTTLVIGSSTRCG